MLRISCQLTKERQLLPIQVFRLFSSSLPPRLRRYLKHFILQEERNTSFWQPGWERGFSSQVIRTLGFGLLHQKTKEGLLNNYFSKIFLTILSSICGKLS